MKTAIRYRWLLVLSALWVFCSSACAKPKDIRILYWNIQNGMWADQQAHYDRTTCPSSSPWADSNEKQQLTAVADELLLRLYQ